MMLAASESKIKCLGAGAPEIRKTVAVYAFV